jgi:hypothetical protein
MATVCEVGLMVVPQLGDMDMPYVPPLMLQAIGIVEDIEWML